MKKQLLLFVLCIVTLIGCRQEEIESSVPSLESVLQGSDFKVKNNILYVRNQKIFDSLSSVLLTRTPEFVSQWEKSIGISSIRSIQQKAVEEESRFLDKIVEQYGDDPTLTRQKIGYSNYTNEYLKKGVLTINEDETVDMNITSPAYSSLVNENRIANIGGKIVQFNLSNTKIINDGNTAKVLMLDDLSESDEDNGIEVHKVEHTTNQVSEARIKAVSCDVNSGGYRLIAYENTVGYFTGYTGCTSHNESYYIQLRSLKKILGTWQNHNTSQWSFTATLKLELWAAASSFSGTPPLTPYLAETFANENGVNHAGPFGNTWNYYYLQSYPTECYGLPAGYYAQIVWRGHSYIAYGKNGTTCNLGNTDTHCFFGNVACPY